jgi:3-methyladenine DNA glycosylase AlkD
LILNDVSECIQVLTDLLASKRENHFAERMSAYMKYKFVYFGLMADARKSIQKTWLSYIKKEKSHKDYWLIIEALWEKEEREFQYIAIDWMNSWKKEELKILSTEKFEWLITQKSWWDSVDALASNVVGKYYAYYPEQKAQMIKEFRHSENMWLERTTLIFQLKYKSSTNFQLLKELILQFQYKNEFFIQKAIGWSLRQHARIDAQNVENTLKELQIKGLALREAQKHFEKYGINKIV